MKDKLILAGIFLFVAVALFMILADVGLLYNAILKGGKV